MEDGGEFQLKTPSELRSVEDFKAVIASWFVASVRPDAEERIVEVEPLGIDLSSSVGAGI